MPFKTKLTGTTKVAALNVEARELPAKSISQLAGTAVISGATLSPGGSELAPFRRDFEIIRALLLAVEQGTPAADFPKTFGAALVDRHRVLLIQAGFAQGVTFRQGDEERATLTHLTWAGHDLLAILRNETLWQKARTQLLDFGNTAHSELLVNWLKTQKLATLPSA